MGWKSWLLVLIGVPAILAVGLGVLKPRHRTPLEVLDSVRREMELPAFDEIVALRDLDLAFAEAKGRRERDAAIQILSLRAHILKELGSFQDAQATLEVLQRDWVPDDPHVAQALAEVEIARGESEAARERLLALLEVRPDFSAGWRLLGLMQREEAKALTAAAIVQLESALVHEDAERASAALEQLAVREEGDPERAARDIEVREALRGRDQALVETVLDAGDEASNWNARARASLSRGLRGDSDPDSAALAAFLDLFLAAGRSELAAELGVAARRLPAFARDAEAVSAILDSFVQCSRRSEVSALLSGWRWRDNRSDSSFLRRACSALYEIENWRSLWQAGSFLRAQASRMDVAHGNFYEGYAAARLARAGADADERRATDALERLEHFTSRARFEPFAGAKALAFGEMAEIHARHDQPREERAALEGVVLSSPVEEVDADAWIRLVELQLESPNAGYFLPEERWTRALSRAPRRTDELLERWHEIGEASLTADGRDFETVFRQLVSSDRVAPSFEVGPYTRWRLARAHLDVGNTIAATQVAKKLHTEYPGLLPAIDVLFEAYRAQGQTKSAARMVLARMLQVGRDERAIEQLELLGSEVLAPHQVLAAVRADPGRSGRLSVARHLIERGQAERALQALESAIGTSGPEALLLASRALFEVGRFEEAARVAGSLANDPLFAPSALAIEVDALLSLHDVEAARAAVRSLSEAQLVDSKLFLRVVDRLFQGGNPELAQPILERLDADATTRGGEVSLRLAQLAMFQGDAPAALEALDRAEPYLSDGRPELLRLLLRIEHREWHRLPEQAAELRAVRPRLSALADAILALFEERLEAGHQMAAQGLDRRRGSAEWALVGAAAQMLSEGELDLPAYYGRRFERETANLLRGDDSYQRDPRSVLGLLLAMEPGGWSAWGARHVLALRNTNAGQLWPLFLAARALSAQGRTDAALENLEVLTARFPDFGPGWDARLSILRATAEDDYAPEVVEVANQRIEALPRELAGDELEVTILRSAQQASQGDRRRALKALSRALDEARATAREEGQDPPTRGQALLARLHAADGDKQGAAAAYSAACEALPATSDNPLVAEFLRLLGRDGGRGKGRRRVTEMSHRLALSRLEERFYRDPLVTLALARFEYRTESRNPGIALALATQHLRAFRKRTENEPLDNLREGSSARWIRWLLPRAPRVALEFLEHDLLGRPGDPELWLLLAETHETLGEFEEAYALYEQLVPMTGDARAHLGLANLMARRGVELTTVEQHLRAAEGRRAENRSARATFVRQLAELELRNPELDRIVSELEALWEVRDENEGEIPAFLLGRTLVRALLARGAEGDLTRLNYIAVELEQHASDSFDRQMLRVMRGLAMQLTDWEIRSRERAAELEARARQQTGGTAGKSDDATTDSREPAQSAAELRAERERQREELRAERLRQRTQQLEATRAERGGRQRAQEPDEASGGDHGDSTGEEGATPPTPVDDGTQNTAPAVDDPNAPGAGDASADDRADS